MIKVQNNLQSDIIGLPLKNPINAGTKQGIKITVEYDHYDENKIYDSEDILNIQHDGRFNIRLKYADYYIFCGTYTSYNRALYETFEFLKVYNNAEHEYVFPNERDIPESLDLSKRDWFMELWDELDKIKSATFTFDQLYCEVEF